MIRRVSDQGFGMHRVRVCMERCPFDVDVLAKLRRAVEVFETSAG
jgi:predicted aldo/keto reductase-like oxidoreductase